LANPLDGLKPARYIPRAIAAIILAALTLTILYMIPRAIQSIITEGKNPQLLTLLDQILNPLTPTIGAVASVLVFAAMLLRRTRLEGPTLLILGASLIVYSYTFFQGGSINIQIPSTAIQQTINEKIPLTLTANLTINLTTIMLASMITSTLIILKGVMLTYIRLKNLEKRIL
jgi:hypothetical protein